MESKYALEHEEDAIPVSLFNRKLTALETVVLYLKENRGMQLSEIAGRVKRDQRNLWNCYHAAKKKHPHKLVVGYATYWIPVSVFDSGLSALEAIVVWLKNAGLTYHNIAALLQRDDRTIWTVYQRARKKHGKR